MKQTILLLTIFLSLASFGQEKYNIKTALSSPDIRLKAFIFVDSVYFYVDSALQSSINPQWVKRIEVIKDESQKHIYSNKKGVVLVYPKHKNSEQIIQNIAKTRKIDISPIKKQLSKFQEFVIYSGIGFHNYKIDTTSLLQVVSEIGVDFEIVKYGEANFELIYKKYGVSFCFDDNTGSSIVRGVTFMKPFNGITNTGIRLNTSIMKDVEKAYKELDWYSTNDEEYWWSEYRGIEFGVNRIMDLPQYPLDEEKHINKTIEIITTLNPLDF